MTSAALNGLRVAVLISGGIAAYKVAELVSRLIQAGSSVRVVMSEAATRFVGPITFQGLTGEAVLTTLWSVAGEPHVELGRWAQVVILAPATANTLSRLAQGGGDDALSAVVLATVAPVVVAPAMDTNMWNDTRVQANVEILKKAGMRVVDPERGRLASGYHGVGRLPSVEVLLAALAQTAGLEYDLAGRRVVVSAGGTREPIDPVRYIGNRSSGRMGWALALAAAARGAAVELVSTASHPTVEGIEIHPVESAEEMLAALRQAVVGADLLLMAAAVADFRVAHPTEEKIRREGREELTLQLIRNVDVLGELRRDLAGTRPYQVGFAAEGKGMAERAAAKLNAKQLDAIVANDIRQPDIGFESEENAGLLLFADGSRVEIPRMSKREMADRILTAILPRLPQ